MDVNVAKLWGAMVDSDPDLHDPCEGLDVICGDCGTARDCETCLEDCGGEGWESYRFEIGGLVEAFGASWRIMGFDGETVTLLKLNL